MMLTSAQKQALRAQAHHLHAIIIVGQQGLTEALIHEIDRALTAHELIKIKWRDSERSDRLAALDHLCERLSATPITLIGKHLVIWRPNPVKDEASSLTREKPKAKPIKNARGKKTGSISSKRHYRDSPTDKGGNTCQRRSCRSKR